MGFKPYKPRSKIKGPFRSKVEERFASYMTMLGVPWAYEQDKFTYVQPAVERTYTPDFTINQKPPLYLEVKGRLDLKEERDKLINIRDSNPHLDLIVICPRDRKVYRNKLCSEWLAENNFKFFIGECPPIEFFN